MSDTTSGFAYMAQTAAQRTTWADQAPELERIAGEQAAARRDALASVPAPPAARVATRPSGDCRYCARYRHACGRHEH